MHNRYLENEVDIFKKIGAGRFFDEFDLPEDMRNDLKEGWRILEERRKARAEAGVPLPEGGCFVFGESSVVAQGLAEFHQDLANRLKIPVENIRLQLKGKDVVADVNLPNHWLEKGDKVFLRTHLEPIISDLNVIFFKKIRERWSTIRLVRENLVPSKENGESWLNG